MRVALEHTFYYAGGVSESRGEAEPLAGTPVGDALAGRGLRRHVACMVNSLAAALPLVEASDLVLMAPRRVLERPLTPRAVLRDCPVEAPAALRRLDLAWQARLARSPAHDWLRGAMAHANGGMPEAQAPP